MMRRMLNSFKCACYSVAALVWFLSAVNSWAELQWVIVKAMLGIVCLTLAIYYFAGAMES